EPSHIVGDDVVHSATELHTPRMLDVAGDLLSIELDAPSFEQLSELVEVRSGAHGHGRGWLQRLRHGIDKGQNPPALQGELVDGISRLRRKPVRLDDHQHIDVFGYFVQLLAKALDLEYLADLLYHHLRWQRRP